MATVDYEKKINSRGYLFFDNIYRLIVINMLTVLLSCTVICLYPSFVSAYATLKEGRNGSNIFKQYFINFKTYFKKAFFTGLWLIILFAIVIYAIYFYYNSVSEVTFTNLFINAGFSINLIAFLLLIFLSCHFPLLIITFKSLTVGELYRTSLFVTFRYILTTLIIFVFNILIIGILVLCLFIPQVLPVWLLIGISLPTFLVVKLTYPVYYKLEKIDFEKFMHAGEYEEEENDESDK